MALEAHLAWNAALETTPLLVSLQLRELRLLDSPLALTATAQRVMNSHAPVALHPSPLALARVLLRHSLGQTMAMHSVAPSAKRATSVMPSPPARASSVPTSMRSPLLTLRLAHAPLGTTVPLPVTPTLVAFNAPLAPSRQPQVKISVCLVVLVVQPRPWVQPLQMHASVTRDTGGTMHMTRSPAPRLALSALLLPTSPPLAMISLAPTLVPCAPIPQSWRLITMSQVTVSATMAQKTPEQSQRAARHALQAPLITPTLPWIQTLKHARGAP